MLHGAAEGATIMSKLSDFYIGVLDFFGALLPGIVTVGAAVALDVPSGIPGVIEGSLGLGATKLGAFMVVAYVVGQVSNSLGSFFLDLGYDTLYAPGKGWLSPKTPQEEPRKKAGSKKHTSPETESEPPEEHVVPRWKVPLVQLEQSVVERGADLRKKLLSDHLDAISQAPHGKGNYARVRAYLKVAMPEAFADVEKLEGDQKFFRALTVGTVALALLVAFDAGGEHAVIARKNLVWPLGIAFILFFRYIAVRRKTIERAYTYFSLRRHARSPGQERGEGGKEAA
jgi:hypothetical protein